MNREDIEKLRGNWRDESVIGTLANCALDLERQLREAVKRAESAERERDQLKIDLHNARKDK